MSRVPIALVGLGRMGRAHYRVLREIPGFELTAVVEAHGAPPPDLGNTRFLRTVEELAGVPCDAVVVATPTVTHHALALKLIAMGKHVLLEKPIASSFEQAREIIAAAQAKGVKLAVGHVERFNPAVRKLREVIREGWLGKPIHYAFTRVGGYPETILAGNNVMLDLAVHDIDVLRSLVGPVKLEHSMCHVTWREGIFDTAEFFLAGGDGTSASVHVNWITPTKIRTIRVTGTRGACFVDYILQTCELLGGQLLKRTEPVGATYVRLQEIYRETDKIQFGVQKVEPLRAEHEQFHAWLTRDEAGELCGGRDGAAAVLLAERAMRAEATRAPRQPVAANAALPGVDDEWV